MTSIGEKLFSNIEENEYLKSLLSRLISNYTQTIIFNVQPDLEEKEKVDILRFADILSKSNSGNSELHFNTAQLMLSMLKKLFPNNPVIDYYLGSVLSNVKNYFGLSKYVKDYENSDFLEFYKESLIKNSHKLPFGDDSFFINNQKIAYRKIKDNHYYSYSAPTSMGKTFLVRKYIEENIRLGVRSNYAIVVPSKALINEISSKLINELGEQLHEKKYRVIKTPAALQDDTAEYSFIMVYTQERLLHHLIKNKNIKIDSVFIDEAHKISEKNGRSAFFYKALKLLNKENRDAKIYFSCPNIPNPEIYLQLIDNPKIENIYTEDIVFNKFNYSPVNQQKIIINKPDRKILSYCDFSKTFINIEHEQPDLFIQEDIDLIRTIGKDKTNIIFCNSKKEAVEWSIAYAEKCNDIHDVELDELISSVKEDIHEDCYLADILKKGVAFHVAYVPTFIKEKIEELFKKGTIKTVFCTSTLLEGVNFPADNLFLLLKEKSIWLKEKEHANFKNLIGRVGRIEFNLLGNVFLISDQTTLEKCRNQVQNDIEEQKLSIETSLSEANKEYIVDTLLEGETRLLKEKRFPTYEIFDFARYSMNMLIKDIINKDLNGAVYTQFKKNLTEEKIETIYNKFTAKDNLIPDDLIVTMDQVEHVDAAVKNEYLNVRQRVL